MANSNHVPSATRPVTSAQPLPHVAQRVKHMVELLGLGETARRLGLSRQAAAAVALREKCRAGTLAIVDAYFTRADNGEPNDGTDEANEGNES